MTPHELFAALGLTLLFAMAMTYGAMVRGRLYRRFAGVAALVLFVFTVTYVMTRLEW